MPIKKNKISYTLDLERLMDKYEIKPGQRKTAAQAVGTTILEAIERRTNGAKTTVRGGRYKRKLSTEYKAFKESKGLPGKADMRLKGDMKNALTFDATKLKVTLKITDDKEKKKSFNHLTGDTLPQRQWLPDDQGEPVKVTSKAKGKTFDDKILKEVTQVIKEFK
jgi:hypothetical protein